MKVKIIFKSGKTRQIESNDFYKGQFKQWFDKNFIKYGIETYKFVVWSNICINVDEIELIEEIE